MRDSLRQGWQCWLFMRGEAAHASNRLRIGRRLRQLSYRKRAAAQNPIHRRHVLPFSWHADTKRCRRCPYGKSRTSTVILVPVTPLLPTLMPASSHCLTPPTALFPTGPEGNADDEARCSGVLGLVIGHV
ncbi:unnamed protein product, partial [Phaeothamnion confervicola]